MKKKKIAIFGVKYFPARGGTSRVVENLLYDLKNNYDFTIYCYKHEAAANHIPGVETIQFSEIPIKGIGVFLYYLRCCVHLLFNKQYDLVHLHKMDAAFFLPLLCLKFKVIATSHALPHLNEKWSAIGKRYFLFSESLFMHSKATLTAISKPQTLYFFEKYKREVAFIPNGILPVGKIQVELADEIMKQFNIPNDFLLFAGRRLIPLKGCHTLIKALQKMAFKGTLVVAGDMDQMPAYTEKLKKLAEGINVRFIGYVSGMDKLNALLKRAKYFVFPSEIEGMSMMLLEAGSIGTPMICSDIPPNLAVLNDQEVLYFESKNVDDLAEKLTWAFQNKEAMEQMAIRTKNTVEKEYMSSKVVKQYIELYDHTLSVDKMIPSPDKI
ncbi:MAG: glycosyltransferase involved in cell wall biosynthesis [Saprospiraceae bacterium]|jgi:glycosyltransferase involved in cell wall biosynthesis